MKRLLVTGYSGFVGRNLKSFLEARKFEIHVVARKAANFDSSIHFHQADLLKFEEIRRVINEVRPTHLLHLAWYVEHGKFWSAPENQHWLEQSMWLVRYFYEVGGHRAVTAGTCAEYSWDRESVLSEGAPTEPFSPYGRAKLQMFRSLSDFARLNGLSYAHGRIFHLYGPYENRQRFVAALISAFMENRDVPTSHGRQVRDFLHVIDVACAFAAILDNSVNGAINIGSGDRIRLLDVIGIIKKLTDSKADAKLGALPAPSNDPDVLVPDVTILKDQLGWRPIYNIETGLMQTIEWWRHQLQQ